MKILVVADVESKYIWDYFDPKPFKDIELIISCGDLKSSYLSFLVTMINAPLLYVHGNHDTEYINKPPLGCDPIDDNLICYKGIRIMGLGGSYRYKEGEFQYTEKEMQKRYNKLKRKIKNFDGIDILVTHAPSFGLLECNDLPHRGFNTFNAILTEHEPKYYLHGHVHLNYSRNYPREQKLGKTTIVNGYNYYIIDYNNSTPYQVKKSWFFFRKKDIY